MSDAGKALFNKGATFNELVTIDGGSTANTVLALDSSTANTFLKITDDYALPVFGSFIYNPDAESAFLVFGISF